MPKEMEGKNALVTGASAGIGRSVALLFAEKGAKVIVADVKSEQAQETVQLIEKVGSEAVFVKADVSRFTEVEALIDKAVRTYGQLDYACNNAGIDGALAPTAECTEENWDLVMNINLKGVWLCMKYEIMQMLKQGAGAIVNTASVVGVVGIQGLPAYCASKHGVLGLTKSAALEYAQSGIRVNAVCPGATLTPMVRQILAVRPEMEETFKTEHPLGRCAEPKEIAEAVIWLCSDAASFVTGHHLLVDGGYVTH